MVEFVFLPNLTAWMDDKYVVSHEKWYNAVFLLDMNLLKYFWVIHMRFCLLNCHCLSTVFLRNWKFGERNISLNGNYSVLISRILITLFSCPILQHWFSTFFNVSLFATTESKKHLFWHTALIFKRYIVKFYVMYKNIP